MIRRVAVTGLGLVSPYGGDLDDFFVRLLRGESAVRYLRTDDEPQPLAMPFVSCADFDAQAALGKQLALMMERFAQLGLAAALHAWSDAGFARQVDGDSRDDWGCIWGTGLGGVSAIERGYSDLWLKGRKRLSPLSVVMGMNNAANAHISMQLGLGGISTTHSAACASSTIAIGEAFHRIRSGAADVMLGGGSDASHTYGTLRAWDAMRIIAKGDGDAARNACRPFSTERSGLVLGEGGAALVLEEWEHARRRGAPIYAEVAGYGASCDREHLVRPSVNGQVRALRGALVDAGLAPADVAYVNAHATGTPEGDPVEIAALKQVFAEHAPRLAVSATKSMHGHLLGASGAIEALVTVLSVNRQALPPTANLADHIAADCLGVDHVVKGRTGVSVPAALSNSFAFGGSNAVLVFRSAASS